MAVGQVEERRPGMRVARLTASVYITASFQALCSAWRMEKVIAMLQMGTLKRLGHVLATPAQPIWA